MWRLAKAIAETNPDAEQPIKLEWLYKVYSDCKLNSWPDSSVG